MFQKHLRLPNTETFQEFMAVFNIDCKSSLHHIRLSNINFSFWPKKRKKKEKQTKYTPPHNSISIYYPPPRKNKKKKEENPNWSGLESLESGIVHSISVTIFKEPLKH